MKLNLFDYRELRKKAKDSLEKKPELKFEKFKKFYSKILDQNFTKTAAQLPYLFYGSLKDKYQETLSLEALEELALNNIIGWCYFAAEDIKYDSEDDQFDEIISILREVFFTMLNTYANKEMQGVIRSLDTKYRFSLEFESKRCKFGQTQILEIPDFKDFTILADRSYALYYACVILGQEIFSTKDMEKFLDFAKYQIIAKQLNDDARDWQQDLNKEFRINSVLAYILKKENLRSIQKDDIANIIKEYKKSFLEKYFVVIMTKVSKNLTKSTISLREITVFRLEAPIYELLSKMQQKIEEFYVVLR